MELEGNSNGESSVAFLERLRKRHGGRLGVIWDNAPAPLRQAQEGSSDAVIPGDPWPEPAAAGKPAGLQPDFNADEPVWGWVREEARGIRVWEARPWYSREPAISSPAWPAGAAKSNGAAGPSCNQGPKHSCETRSPIRGTPQMHIPLWLWFRSDAPIEQKLVRDEQGYVPTGTAHDTVISISDSMQCNHPDPKQGDTRLALDRPLRAIGDGGRSSALIGSV